MNTAIFTGKMGIKPELQYVQEKQMATGFVLIASLREGQPESSLSLIAWSATAEKVANLNQDEQVLVKGQLSWESIERPEGFKEKRVQLVVSFIQKI